MGEILPPLPVKLICPVLCASVHSPDKIISLLEESFGRVDYISECIPFHYTDYYTREMGENLLRFFTSFETLIGPEKIADIKITTNCLEETLKTTANSGRSVNIDPGYIEASKVVLASTKNFSHRIYLKKGIYAEVTLIYTRKSFQDLPWTFPDYRTSFYKEQLHKIRSIYMQQLRV